jgi:hypothetical protein
MEMEEEWKCESQEKRGRIEQGEMNWREGRRKKEETLLKRMRRKISFD